MREVWKAIPDTGGRYEASNLGNIRRADTRRVLSGRVSTNGYRNLTLSLGSRANRRTVFVHQIVALLFKGPCPPGLVVNHENGNKLDCCVKNLTYVTSSENARHAYRVLGRQPSRTNKVRGSKHHFARFTAKDVLKIRAAVRAGATKVSLARKYGVSDSAIGKVCSGENWGHVGNPITS